jgi:hypothetical protein
MMIDLLREKTSDLTIAVTSDPRWDLTDELMVQVFGFTLYGYVVGVGRILCILDMPDINSVVEQSLIGLGIGRQYAQGLVRNAQEVLLEESSESVHSQLIGIGHSHFRSESFDEVVNSVFNNTAALKQ